MDHAAAEHHNLRRILIDRRPYMKSILRITIIAASLTCIGLSAQVKEPIVAAPTGGDTEPIAGNPADKASAPAAEKEPPALELKVTKIFSQGNLYARLISINTGEELIGLTVPARYGTSASEDRRDIVVYLDSARRDWVKFKLLPEEFTEFTHEAVWPEVSRFFGDANPVRSTSYVMGRKVLNFTAVTGNINDTRHQRVQLISCQGGTLLVSTTTFDKEADVVFYKLKQLVSSLQFAGKEKDLKHEEPIFED